MYFINTGQACASKENFNAHALCMGPRPYKYLIIGRTNFGLSAPGLHNVMASRAWDKLMHSQFSTCLSQSHYSKEVVIQLQGRLNFPKSQALFMTLVVIISTSWLNYLIWVADLIQAQNWTCSEISCCMKCTVQCVCN